MQTPKLCLTLTERTLQKNLEVVEKYRGQIDIAELRADFLDQDESFHIRKFPSMAKIPCILTIRRKSDGGNFLAGEAARTVLFGRALSFADEENPLNNFQYVDFEDDFFVSSLQDAALAFGTRIIRSCHNMTGPILDIAKKCDEMRRTGYEIPKIAFMPQSLSDVKNLFLQSRDFKKYDHIFCAMGPLGAVSRILAYKTNSFLTYTSASQSENSLESIGHIDPVLMNEMYRIKSLNEQTQVFGITGWPLLKTESPRMHNEGYKIHSMNAVYVPLPSKDISEAVEFANAVDIRGLSVTVPHKETVVSGLFEFDERVEAIGACNTIVRKNDKWYGYNTDVSGFAKAILEFTGLKNLRRKKISIIGAGGAARAVACAVRNLGGKACVFNRTLSRAEQVAETFDFAFASLSADSIRQIKKYSDIIIQTTSVGMNSSEMSNMQNDPLYFYKFSGKEILFDLIYTPNVTPVMQRAMMAGCKACNGSEMLKYQGYEQFKIFTGVEYAKTNAK